MSTEEKIRSQLATNPVIIYIKGTAQEPQCGFSKAAVEALNSAGIEFAYVNILAAPFIREKLPSISNWPTFPQLFIKGELVGGSDVVCDMVADGSLQQHYQSVMANTEV
jgi:monothiol glutaredoxin